MTDTPPTADSVTASPPEEPSSTDEAGDKEPNGHDRRRPYVLPGLTALATTAAAAFPTVYQLDPGLATRSGVWNWGRWPAFALWCAFILVVAFRIAMNQARGDAELQRTTAGVHVRLNESMKLANAQFGRDLKSWQDNVEQMEAISENIARTASELSELQFSMDLTAAQRSIKEMLEEAATLPIEGLGPLPPNPIVAVTVVVNTRGEQRLFLPDLELLDGTIQRSRTLTRLLQLDTPRAPGQMAHIELDDRIVKEYLPGWREREDAFVVPLLRKTDLDQVGSLVVALSRSAVNSVPIDTINDRCRNMAENIQLSVERISDQLCDSRRQPTESAS